MVGFLDDYLKFIRRRSKGMTMTTKFIGQFILAIIIGLIAFYDSNIGQRLDIPFLKGLIIN